VESAGNYRVTAQLVASRAVLSSTELVSYRDSTDLLEIGLSVVDWIGLVQDMYR
jgi:hypothetical protein